MFIRFCFYLTIISFSFNSCKDKVKPIFKNSEYKSIVLIGNNLGSRMINFGHLESEIYKRLPDQDLIYRNICDGGNTPNFRPHSGRDTPWAFSGAEVTTGELSNDSNSKGHFQYPDEWLTELNADLILAFWGYNESFEGIEGIQSFESELESFIMHTNSQKYNGLNPPSLVLLSPIAFEDISDKIDIPNGQTINQNLSLYNKSIQKIAAKTNTPYIDLFSASQSWYKNDDEDLTIDGHQLNDRGYKVLGQYVAEALFDKSQHSPHCADKQLVENINNKNWYWHNYYNIPNGVHVFGRRYDPYGPENYPSELAKIKAMTSVRDSAIWALLKGAPYSVDNGDFYTPALDTVKTNYTQPNKVKYLYGDEALASFTLPKEYQIELFASEREFPDLANPVQLSFDDKGRLWVATMPSYPHYKPGDERPNDKILILEDVDKDGKADKQMVFADSLHLPIGFEITEYGVFVSQGTHLKLYKDLNGDDKADVSEIVLSGFDDHDTHHAISAFCADPSGAIYMGEGVFLHSNIETPYGPIRGTNGGFYRYNHTKRHLERTSQVPIPNPWGIAFDKWGQNFFTETSGPLVRWMMPGTILPRYGQYNPQSPSLIDKKHEVRPTSGLEFLYSRHFPDELQGALMLNNTIGFLGTKVHFTSYTDDGYTTNHALDLVQSKDPNFRPVDLEVAPDGSLFLVDWHNVLIGHMQHNARDPLRDHVHGRIYRITHKNRPLVNEAKIADANITELLNNLKLPEYRSRYRSKRALRKQPKEKVLNELDKWIKTLDLSSEEGQFYGLEGLWVYWGINQPNSLLIEKLLKSDNPKIRAAVIKLVRYNTDKLDQYLDYFTIGIKDANPNVRLESMVAASWLIPNEGNTLLDRLDTTLMNDWTKEIFFSARAHLNDLNKSSYKIKSNDKPLTSYQRGAEIYSREGFCGTCHQPDGNGLESSGYPTLANTDWIKNQEGQLIKIVLKGLYGPIVVNGKSYEGQVPMTAYEKLLNDQQIADVLTYVRQSFGNNMSSITKEDVSAVRKQVKNKKGFYTVKELMSSNH